MPPRRVAGQARCFVEVGGLGFEENDVILGSYRQEKRNAESSDMGRSRDRGRNRRA